MTDVRYRDEFSLTTKQECVPCNTLSGTMSGFAGSGKTHTLALVTGEKPPSLRISTPLNQVPTRTITQTNVTVEGMNFTKISDEKYTEKVLVTAKECVAGLRPTGFTYKLKCGMRKRFHKPSEPTDPVERELLVKYHTLSGDVRSLKGQIVIDISDCGGQPQFLESLPRFLENIDFSILVANLSESFDEYPVNYFFNKKGKPVGKGVPSQLTNEQIIRLCLRMIASQSQGGRPVKFAIVGTHRDLEGTCIHMNEEGKCKHQARECVEPREVKNQRLREMVESFGLQDGVICKGRQEFIFAINAKNPEDCRPPDDWSA